MDDSGMKCLLGFSVIALLFPRVCVDFELHMAGMGCMTYVTGHAYLVERTLCERGWSGMQFAYALGRAMGMKVI